MYGIGQTCMGSERHVRDRREMYGIGEIFIG